MVLISSFVRVSLGCCSHFHLTSVVSINQDIQPFLLDFQLNEAKFLKSSLILFRIFLVIVVRLPY